MADSSAVTVVLLKLVLAPALVVASTLAGRRWGPAVTGALVAFPITAGPVLLVTHVERGPGFTRSAAVAALLGLVALAAFGLVFARLGRLGWVRALTVSWVVVLAIDLVVALRPVPALPALAAALSGTVLALALMPPATAPGTAAPPPAWDLPARALATAALVITLTTAAELLGPLWTGALATFPTAASVIAAFTLAQGGPPASTAVLRGMVSGLFGFAGFCFAVAVLVDALGLLAFLAGVAVAAAVQLAVAALRRRRQPA
ncbi:hypothetical protein SAMN05443637_110110 [Pseudonocardia thermophila]|uniref:Uncharacterized protein n=1 Tax=Pseudonocardia thermophila TaxID=1848 RepID=A0A1M6UJ49_PSETH|nr:hypothetical protein SAMN05443637_110110 [Pseudonocardia thermophila]